MIMGRSGGALLLALDGVLPSAEFLDRLRRRHHLLVAADGAAVGLYRRGLVPDIVLGDLDSIAQVREPLAAAGAEFIELPSQERNDFEKALRWMLERDPVSVTIVGIAGGMTDHTLNNFSIVAKYAGRLPLVLQDEAATGYVVVDELSLRVSCGDRISLIPLPTAQLTTSGLLWELRGEELSLGVREGASNQAAREVVTVEVERGSLILFHYPVSPGRTLAE